jgi:HEAT repeat protein
MKLTGPRRTGQLESSPCGYARTGAWKRWGIFVGLLALCMIMLVLLCMTAIPVIQVRYVTNKPYEVDPADAVGSLGGPDRGVRRLLEYLGSPYVVASWKVDAAGVLDRYIDLYRPQEAVPALAAALEHRDFRVYLTASMHLAVLGPKSRAAVPQLIAALSHDDSMLRSSAARVLKLIGPAAKDSVPALRECLRDEVPWVRIAAAKALCRIDKSTLLETVNVLLEELSAGSDSSVSAANALGRIGSAAQEAVPKLEVLLGAKHEDTRKNAAIALGGIGAAAASAMDTLKKAAREDDYSRVRQAAREALEKIKKAQEKLRAKAKPEPEPEKRPATRTAP